MLNCIGKKYQETALLKLIILGLIIGIFIAIVIPTAVPAVAILCNLFVKALKGIAPILVFILVMNAMAQKNADASAAMKPIVKLYVLGTFFASLVGVSMSFLFPYYITITSYRCYNSTAKLVLWKFYKICLEYCR